MLVRNPFDRVVSAWKDKFAPVEGRKYYHDTYGKTIVRKYRDKPSAESLKTGSDVKFEEFFRYVVDMNKGGQR